MTGTPPPPALRAVARVRRFGLQTVALSDAPVPRRGCRVRVSYASVGSTDAMAWRGDYLLHPFPGFVSGYDIVGVLESLDRDARRRGFAVGQRVAAVLPAMGGHATRVAVPGSLLVPVPDGLDSPLAAVLPLDGVTARIALDRLRSDARSVFIQGVSGPVGILAAQLARAAGLRVAGSASRGTPTTERLRVHLADYREPRWRARLREEFGLADGAIDHTGDRALRELVAPQGRIVRISYGGPHGHQKAATLSGSLRTLTHRFAHPAERLVSTPASVIAHRARYRQGLAELLALTRDGALTPAEPVIYPLADFAEAVHAAEQGLAGRKAVIRMP